MSKSAHPSEAFRDQAIEKLRQHRGNHGAGVLLRRDADDLSLPDIEQKQLDTAIRITSLLLLEKEYRASGNALSPEDKSALSEACASYADILAALPVFRNHRDKTKAYYEDLTQTYIGEIMQALDIDQSEGIRAWQAKRIVHLIGTKSAKTMEYSAQLMKDKTKRLYDAEIGLVEALLQADPKIKSLVTADELVQTGQDFLSAEKVGEALAQAAEEYYDAFLATVAERHSDKDHPSSWQARLAVFICSAYETIDHYNGRTIG